MRRFHGLLVHPFPLESLVLLHLLVFSAAALTGTIAGGVGLGPRTSGSLIDEFHQIATHNMRTLGFMVATNTPMVGTVGLGLFAVNGFVFGRMMAASAAPRTWLWLYVPVEILAFALGAAASMRVGLGVAAWLHGSGFLPAERLRESAAAVAAACSGVGFAALLEAYAIVRVWGLR